MVTTVVHLLSLSVTCSNGFAMVCVPDACTNTAVFYEQELSNNIDNKNIKMCSHKSTPLQTH